MIQSNNWKNKGSWTRIRRSYTSPYKSESRLTLQWKKNDYYFTHWFHTINHPSENGRIKYLYKLPESFSFCLPSESHKCNMKSMLKYECVLWLLKLRYFGTMISIQLVITYLNKSFPCLEVAVWCPWLLVCHPPWGSSQSACCGHGKPSHRLTWHTPFCWGT